MLNPVNPHDQVAAARLLEFFSPGPPWHRSLWNPGIVLELSELHEACTASRNGILSEGAVKRLCGSLQRKAGRDPAVSVQEKAFLRQQLHEPPKARAAQHHAIQQLAEHLQSDYLSRWARVLRTQPQYGLENFARSVASHLLDLGFSRAHLHALVKGHLASAQAITLADICDQLHAETTANPKRDFEVLLAFHKTPKLSGGYPSSWLNGHQAAQWLVGDGFDTANIRISAATILVVGARDARGAADAASAESDRLAARTMVATGERLERINTLWVRGNAEPFPLFANARGVRVKALDREQLTYEPTVYKSVDAAIELLAHLEGSSSSAAIAGGWAAIEGLLADTSNRATAADNLAVLVACSWTRAELTALSYKIEKYHPHLAGDLPNLHSNRDRCRLVAELILRGQISTLPGRDADTAAIQRVSKVLSDPAGGLQTIRDMIAEAFHRLYRQRNLVLHGGALDSVSLTASLRTVAKLAGAGLDRIVHAQYVQHVIPLELVARANMSLALLDQTSALACIDLLEHRR